MQASTYNNENLPCKLTNANRVFYSDRTKQPKDEKREIFWNLVLQYSSLVLMLIQGVALIPLYLRYLTANEFGIWLVTSGVATWLAIIDPGVSTLVQQQMSIALGSSKLGEVVGLARYGIRVTYLLAAIIIVVALVASHSLCNFVDPETLLPRKTGWWLLFLSVCGVSLGIVATCTTTLGVALRQAKSNAILAVLSTTAGIAVTLVLLCMHTGVLALPIGIIVRNLFQASISMRWVDQTLTTMGSQAAVPLGFGYKMLGWSALEKLTGTLAMTADIVILGRLLDSATVTSYVLTKRPIDILVSLFQRPVVALSPSISFMVGENRGAPVSAFVTKSSIRIFWILGFVIVGASISLETVVRLWVGPQHFLGTQSSWILVIGLAFSVTTSVFSNLYWASGKAIKFYRINCILSVLIVTGMLIGVRTSGVNGLLIGALLPKVLISVWLFPLLAWRALRLDRSAGWTVGRDAAMVSLAVISSIAVSSIARGPTLGSVWLQVFIALLCYTTVLLLCSATLRNDISMARSRLSRRLTR